MELGQNTTQTSTALWAASLSIGAGGKKGKTKKSEVVHFPEFEEASAHLDDPYWRDILKRCARKKLPRGFTYIDGQLRHRGNDAFIQLPDDPESLARTMVCFIQENGHLLSGRDQEQRRIYEKEQILADLAQKANDWRTVSHSKSRRSSYIREYVERTYGHLPRGIQDELITQIEISFDLKYLTRDHILFINGQIIQIDGITVDENGIKYTRDFPRPTFTPLPQPIGEKDDSHNHYQNWMKYLESYSNYIQGTTKSSSTMMTQSSIGSSYDGMD